MRTTLLALVAACGLTSAAAAQPTAFTYQGRLKNGAASATGPHDFRFTLFNVVSGGVQVAPPQCVDNVAVTEGLLTTTIDFGQQFVTTSALFLQIEVRADTGLTCGNLGGFVTLAPRQAITPTPIANHARSAFALDAADGSPQQAVMVDNAGNVGIGTTTPLANLDVRTTGQGVRIQGALSGVNNGAYLAFANGSGTDLGYIGDGSSGDNSMYLTSYANDIYLYTAAGAALTAKSSGNIGIGTTAPLAKLDVRGNVRLGSSGEYLAPGGQENLRIVRGTIQGRVTLSQSSTILLGSGFSVTDIDTFGIYRITFNPPFSAPPTVTATAIGSSVVGRRFAVIRDDPGLVPPSATEVVIVTFRPGVDAAQIGNFHFVAIGPR